jgi:ribosomal-protein-alanine N-acetyltransferase
MGVMSDTPAVPALETPRLRLRPWVEADAAAIHTAFGDPETMRFWDSLPATNLAETAARIRGSKEVSPQWHAAFAVTLRADDRVVGMVNYHARVPLNRRLAVGWIVATPWRRQGFTREAVSALLDHCFDTLHTHRIEARIEPGNLASAALARQLGFTFEGLMRDWLFVDGQPRDMQLYALLRPDWKTTAASS